MQILKLKTNILRLFREGEIKVVIKTGAKTFERGEILVMNQNYPEDNVMATVVGVERTDINGLSESTAKDAGYLSLAAYKADLKGKFPFHEFDERVTCITLAKGR